MEFTDGGGGGGWGGGAMSAVTGFYLFRLQLNIVFFVLRSSYTLINSAYPDFLFHIHSLVVTCD